MLKYLIIMSFSIRPLSTLDIKKRRLSGRDQILSGGEHLIDGVPFGRPRLRAPRRRPAIQIAPRKRRRLDYERDLDVDEFDDYLNEEEDIDEFHGSRPQDEDDEEEQPLLLTQFGDSASKYDARRVRFPASVTAGAGLGYSGAGGDEELEAGDEEEGDEDEDEDEEDIFNPDAQELADELSGLRALAEEEGYERSPSESDGQERFHTPNEDIRGHTDEQDASSMGDEDRIASRTRSARRTRPQSLASQKPVVGRSSQEPDAMGSEVAAQSPDSLLDPLLLDKIMAIRSAFPQVSSSDCQKLLMKHGKDVSRTWRTLEKSLRPRQGLAETMVLITQLELPREVMIVSSPPRQPAEHLGEVSRIDEDEESDSSSDEQDDSDDSASSSDEENESDNNDSDSNSEATPTRPSPRVKQVAEDSSQDSSEESSSDSDSDSQSENGDHAPQQRNKHASRGQKSACGADSSDSSSEESSTSDSSSESEAPVARRSSARTNRRMVVQSSQSSPERRKTAKSPPKSASVRTAKSLPASRKASDRVEVPSSSSSSEWDERDFQRSHSATKVPSKPSTSATPKTTYQTKSPVVPIPQASHQSPVPPGQGKTRTQKRNQRRRLENQRKKAALEAASSHHQSQDSTMIDVLMAKKNALLQTLGSQSQLLSEGVEEARDSPAVENMPKNVDTPNKGRNDWKQKISYRAVECVQEGIVDISEPPFPFYQRWDPQLQQDSWSTSQRRNKRKSRDSSQFYDSPSLNSHKKRRQDEYSRQVVDEYSYQEDTTTFLANQDDVVLNYDDVSFNAGDGQLPAKGDETDDDLPQLPEDMSSLPELLLKDLAAGAIVAWKQLLCTEATNWQPQLSEYMTAVVIEADSVGHLQVQLAKRDRDVEKNEKKFDEETGQRIYGKFEVPDEDDDEEDLGFRDLVLSQMMDARLLQPAERPCEKQLTSDINAHHTPGDQDDDAVLGRAPQPLELEFEVADSQPRRNSNDVSGASGSDQNQSRTLDHDNQSRMDQQGHDMSQDMDVDAASPVSAVDESFVEETNRDIQKGEGENDEDADFISPIDQISISNERREEISQLMKAEGFRQEVRASIDQSSFLRLGSPSRQLEEEYASSVLHKASSREASSEAPSEYGSKDPSQQMNQQSMDADAEAFHSAPQTPRNQQISSDEPESQQTEKLRVSTKMVKSPRLGLSQVTEVSAQSGRQPDDNFAATHSDDLGVEAPTESPGVMAFDDDHDAPIGDSNNLDEQAVRAQTPTREVYNDDLQSASATKAAATQSKLNDPELSPNGSVSSSGSSASFPDIQVLWSRMATKKFKESSVKIKNEESSQANILDSEHLAPPLQAASPQQNSKVFWSSPARSTRSSGKGKENDSAKSTPKGAFKMASLNTSVSPPALSKPRRKPGPRTSSSSADKGKNADGKGRGAGNSRFSVPEGSQVVSLMTSSPEPEADAIDEPEDEPEYTEMYADDSFDEDYHGDSFDSLRTSQKKTRRTSKSRVKRGASVPVAESKESAVSTNWVPGSQGPSRKASGRFGGRWASTGL